MSCDSSSEEHATVHKQATPHVGVLLWSNMMYRNIVDDSLGLTRMFPWSCLLEIVTQPQLYYF